MPKLKPMIRVPVCFIRAQVRRACRPSSSQRLGRSEGEQVGIIVAAAPFHEPIVAGLRCRRRSRSPAGRAAPDAQSSTTSRRESGRGRGCASNWRLLRKKPPSYHCTLSPSVLTKLTRAAAVVESRSSAGRGGFGAGTPAARCRPSGPAGSCTNRWPSGNGPTWWTARVVLNSSPAFQPRIGEGAPATPSPPAAARPGRRR